MLVLQNVVVFKSVCIFFIHHFRSLQQVERIYCCNLSGGVALIMWFTTNGMCVKNKTIIHVARASNSKRDCDVVALVATFATW